MRYLFLLLASVMDKGTFEDLGLLRRQLDPEILRDVLRQPPRGLFRPGSWNIWHLWLGLKLRPLPPPRAFQGAPSTDCVPGHRPTKIPFFGNLEIGQAEPA